MKRVILLEPPRALLALCLVPLLVCSSPANEPATPARAWDGRTPAAHEWGTFTTVQGSNGVVLDGLLHEERDLPSFVHDLRDVTGLTGVSPKMETPVIYFYTPFAQRLRVHVDFPHGTITQWYPAAFDVNHVGPLVNGMPERPDGRTILSHKDGFIRWGHWSDLEILAPGAPGSGPAVAADDPWRFCREVDANLLRVCNLNAARQIEDTHPRDVVDEFERCLFYRGLGDFPLPLVARLQSEHYDEAHAALTLEFSNRTPDEPLRHLFVVVVREGRAGFTQVEEPPARGSLTLQLPLAPTDERVEQLVQRMTAALVDTGLFEREALAMCRTWQSGWFGEDGVRALYVLPPAFVDRHLPLTLGAPDPRAGPAWDVVRTFVARAELLSPARETALEQTVEALGSKAAETRAEARQELRRWGRFAAPYLKGVLARSGDPSVRAQAQRALDELTLVR